MKKVTKHKRPQPWTWAQEHEERVRKHWRWKLLDAKWENTNAQSSRCVPLSHYGWKAFGFDGKHQPVWTVLEHMSARSVFARIGGGSCAIRSNSFWEK